LLEFWHLLRSDQEVVPWREHPINLKVMNKEEKGALNKYYFCSVTTASSAIRQQPTSD
jgi:hypothetical protein